MVKSYTTPCHRATEQTRPRTVYFVFFNDCWNTGTGLFVQEAGSSRYFRHRQSAFRCNNKVTMNHWRHNRESMSYYPSNGRTRSFIHINRISRTATIRIYPLAFPLIFGSGYQDTRRVKCPRSFHPGNIDTLSFVHWFSSQMANRTKLNNELPYVQKVVTCIPQFHSGLVIMLPFISNLPRHGIGEEFSSTTDGCPHAIIGSINIPLSFI